MSVKDLEARLGFKGKFSPKARMRPPAPSPSLFQSDAFVTVDAPLEEHLAWMLAQCKDHLSKIKEFTSMIGHRVELFLLRQTNDEGSYFSFDPELLAPFVNSGIHLKIKFEYYGTED